MSIKETIKGIKENEMYNLSQIREYGLFPWTRNLQTIRRLVKKDYWGENMLKADVWGVGQALEYRIRGKNIIKFLNTYGRGLLLASSGKTRNGKSKRVSRGS